jgi:hypothetical protein
VAGEGNVSGGSGYAGRGFGDASVRVSEELLAPARPINARGGRAGFSSWERERWQQAVSSGEGTGLGAQGGVVRGSVERRRGVREVVCSPPAARTRREAPREAGAAVTRARRATPRFAEVEDSERAATTPCNDDIVTAAILQRGDATVDSRAKAAVGARAAGGTGRNGAVLRDARWAVRCRRRLSLDRDLDKNASATSFSLSIPADQPPLRSHSVEQK